MSSESTSHKVFDYSVSVIYQKGWELVKANAKPLAKLTLIGIAINVVVVSLFQQLVLNNLDGGSDMEIVAGNVVGGSIVFLVLLFVSIVQLLGLKKAMAKKPIIVSDTIKESTNYLGIFIKYAAFALAIIFVISIMVGLISSVIGTIGSLLFILLLPVYIYAFIRYAFLPYMLIVDEKKYEFLERFKVSENLSKGIYTQIFAAWLVAIAITIMLTIATSIITRPFITEGNPQTSILMVSNSGSEDQLESINDVDLTVGYVFAQFASASVSGFVGLIVTAAFFGMYLDRKEELKA